ncbi:MAG: hypothetical protein ACI9RU_002267 [Litorivivens sp.]
MDRANKIFKFANYNYPSMKKITLMLLLCVFAGIQFQAQKLSDEIKLTSGEPYKVVDAKSKEYIGVGDGATISVKTRGELVIIQRYDTQSMTETDRFEYEDFPPYLKFEDLEMINGHLYYFFSSYIKKEKKFEIYAREVNVNTAKFSDFVRLAQSEGTVINKNAVTFGKQAIAGTLPSHFTITPAFDESKFLVSYKRKPIKRKNSENKDVLGFFMFDDALSPIWGQEVELPYTEDQFLINALACTAKGTAHILGKLKEDNQFVMLSMDQDARIKNVALDINAELFFQEFKITEDGDGNLNVAGIYANGIDYKVSWNGSGSLSFNTNGILISKVDPFTGVLDKEDHEFSIDLINLYQSQRQKDKNEKREEDGKAGINDLVMKEFISYKDGSALVLAEQDFYRSEYIFGKGQITVHRYEDIIMLRTKPNGTLDWVRRLPKTQIAEHTLKNGCGIKYASSPTGHYVLFLDNVNNAEIGPDDVPASHKDGKGGFLTAYKIADESGESEKYTIANILDINGTEAHQFAPSRIFKVDESVFLLEMYIKGKKDNMVKMEFN